MLRCFLVSLRKNGMKKLAPGYAIGVGYPPDWESTIMSIRNDMTILQPNVTFYMIAEWMDTWGLEVSESINVTENGCELLCNFQGIYI